MMHRAGPNYRVTAGLKQSISTDVSLFGEQKQLGGRSRGRFGRTGQLIARKAYLRAFSARPRRLADAEFVGERVLIGASSR